MDEYKGWTIRSGFLTGNLGDISPENYEKELRRELEETFPGATIETPSQQAEGCLPAPLKPHAWNAEKEEDDTVLPKIEYAAFRAYTRACEKA